MKDFRKPSYEFISARTVFRISLWVLLLTILGVYFWGLGQHNTFFENSVISTTILSIAFFVFITVGLYKGVKLKHEASQTGVVPATDALELAHYTPDSGFDFDVGEGLGGILLALVLWILWAIVVAVALWIFSNVVLLVVATFAAMLYWIFFRAMRLVFKNSNKSKGDIIASMGYGLMYTVLYNFWIYGIFLLTAYLKR
jgi:hypothetical protein